MGINKYIRMTFFDDIRKSIFYMAVLTFSIVIIFNIFNVALNQDILVYGSEEYISVSELGFVIMAVSIMFMVSANAYYMEEKYREYAIISVSGRTMADICKIMLIRSSIVTFLSVFVGCFIGVLVSPGVMAAVGKMVGIEVNAKTISSNAVITTVLLMVTELEAVFLVNTGNMYRSNINDLINRKKRVHIPDRRKIKIHPAIYVLIYLLPVISGLMPISKIDKVIFIKLTSVIGLFGIQGVVRYIIPEWIEKYRNKKLILDKYKIIQFSNLYTSIQKSIALILGLVLSIVICIIVGAGYKTGSLINSMSLFCYGLIILIMSFTVIYKFMVEAETRKNNFEQLKLLGYTKAEIKKIIFKEVSLYYLIIICLALPYDIMIVISSIIAELMSITTGIVIVGIYVGVFAFTGVISYEGYKNVVL